MSPTPMVSTDPDRPRDMLILTPDAATVGALLRHRHASGAALLRALLPAECDEPTETDDEAY